jgi:hypothetical protein
MPWRSTRPPSAAARAAQRALDIRAKQAPSNRAGTAVGIARAGQFANRERMSISTIKRIVSFFARHEKSSGSAEARRDPTTKAAQAWGLWGGNPGRAWARRELARYNREKGA